MAVAGEAADGKVSRSTRYQVLVEVGEKMWQEVAQVEAVSQAAAMHAYVDGLDEVPSGIAVVPMSSWQPKRPEVDRSVRLV